MVTPMNLGLGLYRHQLTEEHYRFAKQCGCSHVVAHLVDYFRSSRSNQPGDQPVGDDTGWGLAGDPDQLWTYEELAALKRQINAAGLELEAIENFDPAHWHDILLDGPKKAPSSGKRQDHHSQRGPGRHSHLRLQFLDCGRGGPGERPFRSR